MDRATAELEQQMALIQAEMEQQSQVVARLQLELEILKESALSNLPGYKKYRSEQLEKLKK